MGSGGHPQLPRNCESAPNSGHQAHSAQKDGPQRAMRPGGSLEIRVPAQGALPAGPCGGHTQKLGRGGVEPGHAAGSRVLQSPGCLSPVQLGVLSASLL